MNKNVKRAYLVAGGILAAGIAIAIIAITIKGY
jgi:hypothetical protein